MFDNSTVAGRLKTSDSKLFVSCWKVAPKLSLQGEIDYRAEAENTQRWYDNFKERWMKGAQGGGANFQPSNL